MAWYALYTKPRNEKKVYEQLIQKEVNTFLPTIKSLRQWKDRRTWVEMPLFNGYVFVNIDLKDKLYTLKTVGVVKMVSFGGNPAMIPDWQIEQLIKIIKHPETLQMETYFKKGDHVEITEGPMKGIKGFLRELRGETRVVILIDGIYQSVSFVVPKQFIKKVEKIQETRT